MSNPVLAGLHILLLEDDAVINMATQDILEEMGCRVTAVLHAKAAFAAIEQELPGAAVLDVNIGEDTSFEFAQRLRLRGVPFVFLTGYDLSRFGPSGPAMNPVISLAIPPNSGELCCELSATAPAAGLPTEMLG